jgi:hypothetical protein
LAAYYKKILTDGSQLEEVEQNAQYPRLLASGFFWLNTKVKVSAIGCRTDDP